MEQNEINIETYEPKWYKIFGYWDRWAAAIIILLLLLCLLLYIFNENLANKFDWISALLGIIPLVPVVLILYVSRYKQWRLDLPNFLTVNYIFEGKPKLRAELIPLSGLSDIRAQAQTISRIFNEDQANFPLKPALSKSHPSQIMKDSNCILNQGKPFELHEVDIELISDVTKQKNFIDLEKPCNEGSMITSKYPFTQTNVVPITTN